MNECVIYEENHPVGRLCWKSDGLRWHFQARMRACTGVRYLYLLDGRGHVLRLGVPEPSGEEMTFQRSLTRQGLGGLIPDADCRAQLRESDILPQAALPEAASCKAPDTVQIPDAQSPQSRAQEPLRLYREDGQLYIGEAFIPGQPLQLHALFQKMEMREIDGQLCWFVPLG